MASQRFKLRPVKEWSPDDKPEPFKPRLDFVGMEAFDNLPPRLRMFCKVWKFGIAPELVCNMYRVAFNNEDAVIAALLRMENRVLENERKTSSV